MKIFAGLMLATVLLAADSGQDLFQKGLVKERTEADFRGAIKLYERVVKEHSKDRKLAAQALFRIGECQRALGSPDARAAYERVLREFADQSESATEARKRLVALGSTVSPALGAGIVARQISESSAFEALQVPDGRSNVTNLIPSVDRTNGAFGAVLSPDSRTVAYTVYGREDDFWHIQVAAADPGAKPRTVLRNNYSDFVLADVRAWAPDGKFLLSVLWGGKNTPQLVWISVADGSIKPLKLLERLSTGSLVNLSPDGKFIAYDIGTRKDFTDREIRVMAADGSGDSVLVSAPGINAAPVWARDGSRIFFTSDRSGSVGLYSIAVRNGGPGGPIELAKANIGTIAPLGFTQTGSFLYTQSIGGADIFRVALDKVSGKLSGNAERLIDTYVGSNLAQASSADGKSVAYWSYRNGGAALVVRSLDSLKEVVIPATFGSFGKPMWLPDGKSILVGARNSQGTTCFYKADLKNAEFSEVVNTRSITAPWIPSTLSADGKAVYVAPLGAKVSVASFDLSDGKRTDVYTGADGIISLGVSPGGTKLAFIEERRGPTVGPEQLSHLYIANPDGSDAHDLFAGHVKIFVTALAWAADGRSLYFVRSDNLNPSHESQLWRIPASGGDPQYTGFSAKNITAIEVTHDGERLVFSAGEPAKTEYWALDNLLLPARAAR